MTTGRVLLALALLGPLACSSKENNNSFLPPTGGGGSGGTGGTTPNGHVEVTITSPTDQAMVNQGGGLAVSATVHDDGSDFIDSTSVTAVLTVGGSTTALALGQLVSTGSDTYTGTISIAALPGGTYTLTVSAASSGGATGSDTVSISITAGPTLIVNSPVEGKPYNGSLTIEILVDPGAMPPTVTLAGMPVMAPALVLAVPASSTNMYDIYRATIAFGPTTPPPAPTLAFPPLSGLQLLDVTESDGNATSEVKRTFVIDTAGPIISNTFPAPGDIVGGVVPISATVSDESGVLPSSVIAVIGDQAGNPVFTLQLALDRPAVYSTLFDTANLTSCKPPPATRPLHRLSDDLVPRRRLGREPERGRLRLRRRQHRTGRRSRSPPDARPAPGRGRIRVLVRLRSAQLEPVRGRHAQRRLHGSAGVRSARAHRGRRQPRCRPQGGPDRGHRSRQHQRLRPGTLSTPATSARCR